MGEPSQNSMFASWAESAGIDFILNFQRYTQQEPDRCLISR